MNPLTRIIKIARRARTVDVSGVKLKRHASIQHSYSPLNSNIWKIIKPIYENLSSELLERELLDTEMQNNNESLNTLIWNFYFETPALCSKDD